MKKFLAKIIQKGKKAFVLVDKNSFDLDIQKSKVGLYEMTPKRIKDKDEKEARQRTLLENNVYWGICIDILSSYGESDLYWHNFLKIKFLSAMAVDKIEVEGWDLEKLVKVGKRLTTRELTTIEFEEYLKNIREWASSSEWLKNIAGCFVFIPEPNEAPLEDYER